MASIAKELIPIELKEVKAQTVSEPPVVREASVAAQSQTEVSTNQKLDSDNRVLLLTSLIFRWTI